jgi:putative hydrolase of the HAD superfamily
MRETRDEEGAFHEGGFVNETRAPAMPSRGDSGSAGQVAKNAPSPRGLAHVESWIFDLDNTLYPAGSPLWPQIDARITAFVAGLFGIDGMSARALQKYYYQRYGTTLRGLMIEHDLDPAIFLDFAHDIDRSALAADEALAAAIAALPGRRFILTSGSHGHAMKTTAHLKIDHLFEAVFDIAAGDFIPKPDERTYLRFLERFGIDPAKAAMFEDIPRNLEVPYRLGMTTVLVAPRAGHDERDSWEGEGKGASFVDHRTDDLAAFLTRLRGKASSE